ncbi:MAG: hypothetical protein QNK04_10235 [Myxococcota bacterium]|nr:hypothetical protein [Myxococcota bacterium]
MRGLALGLLLSLVALPSAAAEEFVRELEVKEQQTLRVVLHSGNIEVIAHEGDRIRVEVRARGVGASGIRFLLREDADGALVLDSDRAPWLAWLRTGPRVHVRAWVPRWLRLDLRTAGRIVTRDDGVERAFPAGSRLDATLAAR